MSPQVVWSLPKRVAFRFAFIAGALYVYPFPFGMLPKTEKVGELLGKPWTWLVTWVSESVLGAGTPPTEMTGSGDTLFAFVSLLTIVVCAAIGAGVWSALDRKRLAYPRLATGAWILLRYVLALTLLSYGFAKIFNSQFPPPGPARLDQRVGEMSPMGLLWTFQGASAAYTFFGGLAEAVAGVLLLWRRTVTLGALVAIGVMTNVVMLNFCYDVPVKLYSLQLLLIAGVIAMPQLRRVLRAILGSGVPEVAPRVRSSARRERARIVAKVVAIALIAYSIYGQVQAGSEYQRPPNELHGIWKVDTWQTDGAADKPRWKKLIVTEYASQIVTDTEQRMWMRAEVLSSAASIFVQAGPKPELWRYARTDAEHLVIDRVVDGKRVHITLTKEPEPLLVTRGFNWIQEFPFNR